ncbi:unnamed protein product, partial [Fusarium fujikuroi]
ELWGRGWLSWQSDSCANHLSAMAICIDCPIDEREAGSGRQQKHFNQGFDSRLARDIRCIPYAMHYSRDGAKFAAIKATDNSRLWVDRFGTGEECLMTTYRCGGPVPGKRNSRLQLVIEYTSVCNNKPRLLFLHQADVGTAPHALVPTLDCISDLPRYLLTNIVATFPFPELTNKPHHATEAVTVTPGEGQIYPACPICVSIVKYEPDTEHTLSAIPPQLNVTALSQNTNTIKTHDSGKQKMVMDQYGIVHQQLHVPVTLQVHELFTVSGSPASTGSQNQTPLTVQQVSRPKWHGPTKAVLATLLRSDFLKWVVQIDRSPSWRIADNRLGSRFRLGIHELNEASVRFQNDKMLTTSFVPTWICLVSSHPGQSLVPCAGPRSTSLRHAYTKTNFLGTSSHTLQLKHNRHPSASCTLFHLDLWLSGSTLAGLVVVIQVDVRDPLRTASVAMPDLIVSLSSRSGVVAEYWFSLRARQENFNMLVPDSLAESGAEN